MTEVSLFCFPYAGGSSVMYNRWRLDLNPSINLVPVELAGRGWRLNDVLYENIHVAIEDIYQVVKHEVARVPYALFGHSMGAMIAYRLAQKIRQNKLPAPLHVFISGKGAPHIERVDSKMFHLMEDESFKREVLQLGSTPTEIFDHPQLLELFLPLLKNDFMLSETGGYDQVINPLNCDITVFHGLRDNLVSGRCEEWKLHTMRSCNIEYFDDGHFFLHSRAKEIINIINRTIVV